MVSREKSRPVDIYVGGVEHAISHLIYSRFISKFLHDEKVINLGPSREPFLKLVTQGMVKSPAYVCPDTSRYLRQHEVDKNGMNLATNKKAKVYVEKMSKSKFNGIEPSV